MFPKRNGQLLALLNFTTMCWQKKKPQLNVTKKEKKNIDYNKSLAMIAFYCNWNKVSLW